MTVTEFWSKADTRSMDLYGFFGELTAHKLNDNTNLSFQGTVYQDTVDYTYAYNGNYFAFTVMGKNLSVDANGVLTGGTVNGTLDLFWDATAKQWFYDGYVKGFALAAAEYIAPYLTVSRADDDIWFRKLLAGNDLRTYHSYSDFGYGGAGDDTLKGGRGFDTLYGDTGNDHVLGQAGKDHLLGNAGNDSVFGGVGNDTIWGNQGNDLIFGGTGHDKIYGGNDADRLDGFDGNDSLFGGSGHDVLRGHEGNDTLSGGAGDDSLIGGAGADVFVYRAGAGSDKIFGFQDGVDRIQVLMPSGTALDLHVHYANGDATITFMDVTLLLTDVAKNSISLADFDMVPF